MSENLIDIIEECRLKKTLTKGLSAYTQANCQVTLTDDGYRIYRTPNVNPTDNGSTMWGGLIIKPYNMENKDVFIKGHTYILKFHIKGQTSNAPDFGWSNLVGWGGGGLSPSPSDVKYSSTPSNFNGEMDFFYKWTINDDVRKVCTNSYSNFVAGNTYLSYDGFKFGFSYTDTGTMGTDLYITNLRMYDITSGYTNIDVKKNGIVLCNDCIEQDVNKLNMQNYGSILCEDIIEY